MQIQSSILVVAGSLSLTITLGLAWCLAGMRYLESGFLKRLFPHYQYLLKSHIDYLLMTGLLMVFFLLFTHFRVSPSPVVLVAMSIGSLLNPFGFLVLAMKPNLRQHPSTPFGAIMAGSFVLTTIGYVGAAWYVAYAAVFGRKEPGVSMEYAVGIAVALIVSSFARVTGLDRDRAFYATVAIVVASYYVLFAAMGGSAHALVVEAIVMTAFVAVAVVGFKFNLWLVVAALAGHGVLDVLHGFVVTNPGVPVWWPAFCLTYDIAAAAFLAWLLLRSNLAARRVH